MNSYSLKKTYRRLLIESMVDKSTFLIKVIDYLEKNDLEKSSVLSTVIKSAFKELDLRSIIESGDKKKRKKAEVVIHKKLSLIEGLDETPFSFKDISPLYSSIIDYIDSGKEISVSDAMMASDYYIKKMYRNADEEEKALIAKGKMSISKIIEKTDYYKELNKKVKKIRGVEDKVIEIYEDIETKIVYPTSSYAFNSWISLNNYSVDWCTQNPTTWFSYNSSQFVMIGEDKKNREIISLKVNHDGTIDYQGTCDYRNNHMNKSSVLGVIGLGDQEVFKKVNNDPEFEELSQSFQFDLDEFESYIKKFIEFNEYDLIKEMIEKAFQYADADVYETFISNILSYADSKNKKENVVNVIADSFPDFYFNEPNAELNWEDCLSKSSSNVYFCKKVFELAQNRRSHVKYFMMIAKFLKVFDKYVNASSIFKDLFLLAIDKNNVLNFEKILDLCINKRSSCMEYLPDASNFPEMLDTKGVSSFVRQKKGNITKWSIDSFTKQYQRYLTNLFVSHKEKTDDLLGDKSLAEVDLLLINNNYWRYEKQQRFYNMNFSNFQKDFVSLTNDDVNIIQQKVYNDIATTKLFDTGSKKDNGILSKLLREFIEAYKKGNDTIIDVKSEKTFEIFKYLLENASSISEPYKSILEIFDKIGRDINSIPGLIAEKFTDTNYESFYGSNKIENQETLDTYINKLREGFEQTGNINSFSKFINDTVSYLKDRDIISVSSLTLEDKFAISIINISVLKNFLINIDSLNDQRSDYKFDPYIYFYLVKDSDHLNVDIEKLDLFLNSLNASRNSSILVARYLAESMPSNVINSFFSDSNVIKGVIKNSLKHASLAMLIINKANQQDECLNKRSLSNIISNSNFAKVNENLRKLIYENFINISSSYGRNRLDNSERILVRNCLAAGVRKGQKHLSSDSELMLSYCNNLDKYSKFQMRIVFPQKGMLTQNQEEDETIEESLVRQYIRLLLT